MSRIFSQLGLWLWYLLPANPILVRVVQGMSRRPRHLWLRFIYLGVLLAVVMIALLTAGSGEASLGALAKGASRTFMIASIVQLALICFLAPIFTAGAITQERDSHTYNILISTPLSNAQIVIGSLVSRLYFVIVLLLAGLPIFFTTMIYGGVTAGQILRSFLIAGSTAVITGSLAILASMVRAGTRRTIFSFYLTIGVYLLSVYVLGSWPRTWLPTAPVSPLTGQRMSWLAAFHPFLALDVGLNRVEALDLAAAGAYGPVGRYFVAYPHFMYVAQTLAASVLLTGVSVFFVRRCTREGEVGALGRLRERFLPNFLRARAQTRKPHVVWSNPVAWREAVTRASATSRSLGRYVVIGGGMAATAVLLYLYATDSAFDAPLIRSWLAGFIAIEFAIVLLIATNTAASALTKEKESASLDLLLTTPLTSDYIIRGKLRGLISFVVPLLSVPVLSVLAFALYDLRPGVKEPAMGVETAFTLAVMLVVFSAYACLLGLQFSLKQKKTVRAVVLAIGTLILLNLGAFFFWHTIVTRAGVVGPLLAGATPFTAILVQVDPATCLDSASSLSEHMGAMRFTGFIGTLIFASLHGAAAFAWYRAMVKNFDMIIRKQSAQ